MRGPTIEGDTYDGQLTVLSNQERNQIVVLSSPS
jgi:hypothetical protein